MSLDKTKFGLILRLTLGWKLLWAFLDKTFALGFATESGMSWLDGVSPTSGFLTNAPYGPFAEFFNSLAGNVFVDWLFMLGLLLIGLSLILGVGMRIAGYSGALMMLLMWLSLLPPTNNPFVDEHIIYGLLFIGLAHSKAGHLFGLGQWWSKTRLVKKYKWLE